MIKKILICVISMLACISAVMIIPTYCDSMTPHIIIADDVWLYAEDDTKVFLLPKSYYAKIDNLDENYYFITFNGVKGKVYKNKVSSTGYHTVASGTMSELKISEAYSEFDSISIKKYPGLGADTVVSLPVKDAFTFIGKHPTENGDWFYISYQQHYGYIKSERTNNPKLDHPIFVPEEFKDTPPVNGNGNEEPPPSLIDKLGGDADSLKYVLIIGLSIPAVLIILLIFSPTKKKRERYYDT